MPKPTPTAIPFRRRTLATFVACACGAVPFSAHAATRAGKVDFAVGDVTATGADGSVRGLAKGAAIRVGDTIETHAGRAWLRFRDGGYMSLQPGSEFRVDDYHFEDEEDGEERSFFSLLKGGVRAITGLIGKSNRNSYRVTTPVATIGIRGTEYLAQLGDSLTVSCGEGVCVVTNEAGEVVLNAGQTVYVKDPTSEGLRTTRKVVLPPNAPVTYAGGEFREDDGDLAVIPEPPAPPPEPPEPPPPPPPGDPMLAEGEQSGLFLAMSYGGDGAEFGNAGPDADTLLARGVAPDFVTAVLNSGLGLESAEWQDDGTESVTFDQSVDSPATLTEVGVDADRVIAWGRWTGGKHTGTPFNGGEVWLEDGNESLHYVVGIPTPEADLGSLADQSAVATYNLIGATTPSFGDDGFEGDADFGEFLAVTGSLAADFGASTVQTSLVLDFANQDVTINSGTMPIAAGPGGAFGGSGVWSSADSFSGAYNTQIQGFFAGRGASRAGYAYDVYVDSTTGYPINGVVAFEKAGVAVPE